MVEALMTTGTFPAQAIRNHEIRLKTVSDILLREGVSSVLDLGCGDGKLIELLQPNPAFERISGLDQDAGRLAVAEQNLSAENGFQKVELIRDSFCDPETALPKHDAVVLVETIEHVDETQVPEVEATIFDNLRPSLVVVTTPDATNRLSDEKMRQRGHLFEWDIAEFAQWTNGVSERYPYSHEVLQLKWESFVRGTQIAIFKKSA